LRILYDNTRTAVARVLGDGERKKTRAFSELQSHYLFVDKFGRPGKGNDKGRIEDLVGLCPPKSHGADSPGGQLGRNQRSAGGRLSPPPRAAPARPYGDHPRTLSAQAAREYIQVLRPFETFALEEVTAAVEDALR
jgi:hypothetical protein